MLEVTVDFVSEIISCIKSKEKKIVSGDPEKIKKVYDTWKFSKDTRSTNPNWLLIDTQAQLKKKISYKDKKDWETFISKKDPIHDKDIEIKKITNTNKEKTIDLHGYSLIDANNTVEKFINDCFFHGVNKIIIITGKGSRSKNYNNPYQSEKFGILKHSVPSYIENNIELMKKIKEINFEDIKSPSKGSFVIYLKKFKV